MPFLQLSSTDEPLHPFSLMRTGTVAREVLRALHVEGAAGNATLGALGTTLEANMKTRQQNWAKTPYPYGSEFGFDTTGQEEVVVWNLYFGNESVARKVSRLACARGVLMAS